MDELRARIDEYYEDWINVDPHVQDAALDAVGADTIDDVVVTWPNMSENDLENAAWLWKDFLGVVKHKEHELGI